MVPLQHLREIQCSWTDTFFKQNLNSHLLQPKFELTPFPSKIWIDTFFRRTVEILKNRKQFFRNRVRISAISLFFEGSWIYLPIHIFVGPSNNIIKSVKKIKKNMEKLKIISPGAGKFLWESILLKQLAAVSFLITLRLDLEVLMLIKKLRKCVYLCKIRSYFFKFFQSHYFSKKKNYLWKIQFWRWPGESGGYNLAITAKIFRNSRKGVFFTIIPSLGGSFRY